MSNGTEPWESSVEEPTRPRAVQSEYTGLYHGQSTVDTTVKPLDPMKTYDPVQTNIAPGPPWEFYPSTLQLTYAQTPTITFEFELVRLINRFSKENDSNTPDFILADYINGALKAFTEAVVRREEWYGRKVFRCGIDVQNVEEPTR